MDNSDVEFLEKGVNEEINKVYEWLAANKLTLNISKSKFMIVSNKKSTLNDFQVNIMNHPLEQCDKYKYLGVIIDKTLLGKLILNTWQVRYQKSVVLLQN